MAGETIITVVGNLTADPELRVTKWRCDQCDYPWGIPREDPNAEQYAKCSICGYDEWHAVEVPAPRTITINLDTGAWESDAVAITREEGARVAASVLPGMPEEEIDRAYSEWLSADPESSRDIPGFEGMWDALGNLRTDKRD